MTMCRASARLTVSSAHGLLHAGMDGGDIGQAGKGKNPEHQALRRGQ
jgi:hypothetical protein